MDKDITVRFTLNGTALNLNNREAKNTSLWLSLRGLTAMKIFKGDRQLTMLESLDFLAINLTNHWDRYTPQDRTTRSGPLSPKSVSAESDHLVQASQPTV